MRYLYRAIAGLFISFALASGGYQQVPGDSIGWTSHDVQTNGACGKRICIDSEGKAYITWMKGYIPYSNPTRHIEWDMRYTNGTCFGNVNASPVYSGYSSIDITRDTIAAQQRSVIAYHYHGAQYYSYIDIDSANGSGSFPNDPRTPQEDGYIWPCLASTGNHTIVLAMHDINSNGSRIYMTSDEGNTWNYCFEIDSVPVESHFIISSFNPGSSNIVLVHGRYITDTLANGMLDQNVWYRRSTDGGFTWDQYVNLTDYSPGDTVRGYYSYSAVFDLNDNLHIVWSGLKIDSTGQPWQASKIFHWDEVHGQITVVSSPTGIFPGGWWGWRHDIYEAYHMPADMPLLVVDRGIPDRLYCIWCGQDDTLDISAGGYANGDIYASFSDDNGLNWSNYVNITNTSTPGAPAGECADEDYIAVVPHTVNDSIYLTFIEDLDAGDMRAAEGDTTYNPVRLWVFHKNLITGLSETGADSTDKRSWMPTIFTGTLHISTDRPYRIFDITGRQVHTLDPTPGIYFIEVENKVKQKIIRAR